MPAANKEQATLFRMAYAVRTGSLDPKDIEQDSLKKKVLGISNSDMTDSDIKDFTSVVKESLDPEFDLFEMATLGNTPGMGSIYFPSGSKSGSGDVPHLQSFADYMKSKRDPDDDEEEEEEEKN